MVVDVVDLDPSPWLHLRRLFACAGQRDIAKIVVEVRQMLAQSPKRHSHREGITRTHSQRRVNLLIVHVVGPNTQVGVQVSQCPDGLLSWSDRFRHLTNLFHDLGIASEIVDKLGISCSKQALNDRTIARFGPRTGLLLSPYASSSQLSQKQRTGAERYWDVSCE